MEPKFIVDMNVGRLAKWLRAMGYDALFVRDIDDGGLVRIAQWEERVILTRDRQLLERRVVTSGRIRALFLRDDQFLLQLRQVTDELGLTDTNDFTRCIECNAMLLNMDKAQVEERVPPFVFQTQEKFKECPDCGKVYWRGTHWQNMKQELARVRSEAG
ncbi:MAG: Mut7-C RNAse domain-containing protein [Dehalococcoidia bacterium]